MECRVRAELSMTVVRMEILEDQVVQVSPAKDGLRSRSGVRCGVGA